MAKNRLDPNEILAAPPPGGEVIHLYASGYQPGRKPRSTEDTSALCYSSVNYQVRHRLLSPLADAMRWLQRKPTPEDPRPQWRICRTCLGHAIQATGLDETVLALILDKQKDTTT